MRIVIPKEILHAEKRVAAIPETVAKFRQKGFEVAVEAGAGEGIFVSDSDYEKAGAAIVRDVEELFGQADLILKVKQPIFNEAREKHEVDMMPSRALLVTFLHPASPDSHDIVRKLAARRITSLTMDGIPRISRAQRMDALTSMSTVAGYRAVLDAAEYLPRFLPMVGTAIGAIKPATVLVVGAGVAGLQSIATAKRLGAVVKAWDIRESARQEAASLGAKVEGFDVPADLAIAPGGYARQLPEEWLRKEQAAIGAIAAQADIIILSALVPGSLAPTIITEEIVARMRPGSVIIDISIDQGGNCALTKPGQDVWAHSVRICGVQNLPGRMPMQSSWLYANNMYYYIENLFKNGPGTPDFEDEIVRASLVTTDGRIVYEPALEAMGERVTV
ncbi:MAG TPA: NAD(P) transhydrogenase subunit alpha [candidate division Zixibacteria bacterium]|nr:NAD(P) transhydrogenase subunit alpha [candidate division Zixibacteria bacterium]MDD4917489.1 NAD(P) transhydrogenase subunit alpha [candidate division Zixibacteria bacterium]MDM7972296.1 NAD(P) transhydrogenase subunit alpha [candidate division Zixibacteria bacterium]HOD67210.1 NAD(P) transhydrogenase subunit alpha [candidate division Zixibacteria bacterium]HPM36581.1 NAD(P) transhydrogenase subunit alpha [candidate division Zixibacteria bacterium]